MSSQSSPRFPGIEQLTLHDLELWAGPTILSRGRDYQRRGCVANLAVTPDDMLVADVRGSELYAVVVLADEDGRLDSFCSCPCDFTCKHAVAVLLEYLDCLNKGRSVPLADPDDPRLLLLDEDGEHADAGYAGYAEDDKYDEYDEYDDDGDDADDGNKPSVGPGRGGKAGSELEAQLAELSRDQLVRLIVDLAGDGPDLRQRLKEALYTARGDTDNLLKALRREIARQAALDPWDDAGEPDYTGVRRLMLALLEAGRYDDLLEVGEELIRTGVQQVEQFDLDGQCSYELSECVELLLPALRGSSRPLADRLLWALNLVLTDEYGFCDELGKFLDQRHPAEAWRQVVEALRGRLGAMPAGAESSGHSSVAYRRRLVSAWLIHALEGAGLDAEILPLCETEARLNGDYERLVDRLMAAGQDDEALDRIGEGIAAAKKRGHAGTVAHLLDCERKIYTRRSDWQAQTLLEVAVFVGDPDAAGFVRCRQALDVGQGDADMWPGLRRTLLEYLVSGTLPWDHEEWPQGLGQPGKSDLDRTRRDRALSFPRVYVLLDIALEEKNPEDVVRWHALLPNNILEHNDNLQDRVATALQKRFPDQSLAIWKELTERNIALTNKGGYQRAGGYLRKLRQMLGKKRQAEWTAYAKALRQQHARKRRFLDVMDALEDRPLLKKP